MEGARARRHRGVRPQGLRAGRGLLGADEGDAAARVRRSPARSSRASPKRGSWAGSRPPLSSASVAAPAAKPAASSVAPAAPRRPRRPRPLRARCRAARSAAPSRSSPTLARTAAPDGYGVHLRAGGARREDAARDPEETGQGSALQVLARRFDGHVAEMEMSNFAEIVVGARISKSGQAMPQSGDLEGAVASGQSRRQRHRRGDRHHATIPNGVRS